MFTITPTGDAILEADETILISMDNLLGTALAVGITDGATVTINNDDSAAVTIADISGAENGGGITVTATLDNAVQGGFNVNVSSSDGTATTSDSDYTAISSQTLSFAGSVGETQIFTLTPTADIKLEADEILNITQGNLAATTLAVDITDGATVTINNDDASSVTIGNGSAIEGDDLSFNLTLTNDVQGDVVIDVSFTHVSTEAGDFTSDIQTIIFTNGNSGSQTVTVPTTEDSQLESSETFIANLALGAGNVNSEVIVSDTGTGTITDDDDAAVTISDATIIEGGDLSFDVILNKNVQGDVVVDISFTNISASNNDYDELTQQVTFAGGTAGTETITLDTSGDLILEADETFTANLSLVSGNPSINTSDTGVGTITDNDTASVTIDDITSEEGDVIVFNLSLNNNVQGNVVVDVSFTNVSTEISDFTNIVQTITFINGISGSQTVTVPTTEDTQLESTETFTANLALGTGNVNSEVNVSDTGIGSITDDDSASLTITDESGNEDTGAVIFTATLDNAVEGGFEVDVNTADGTATVANGDYTSVISQTLVFAGIAGENQDFSVSPTSDGILEEDETVNISMNNLSATVLDVQITDNASLTILNDDAAAIVTINDAQVIEGGVLSFDVNLDKNVQGDVVVDVSFDHISTEVNDFTGSAQTVTFVGGLAGTETITLGTTDDLTLETDETFTANLTLNSGNPAIITTDAGLGTITNNDTASVTIDDITSDEGDDIVFNLSLNNTVEGDVVVDVSFTNISTSDNDYEEQTQQVTFSGGSTGPETVTIGTSNDLTLETDESFTASLSLDSGNPAVITSDTGLGTITDDDDATVSISDASIIEGNILSFDVSLDNNVQGDVVVDLTFTNISTSNNDFQHSTQQVTFAGGSAGTNTVNLSTTDDSTLELNETFTASQSLNSGNLEVVTTDTGLGTIIDDDNAEVTINNITSEEGDAIVFDLILNNSVEGDVVIDVSFSNISTSDNDYASGSQTITFANGFQGVETLTVPTTEDSQLESNETFSAILALGAGNVNSDVVTSDTGIGTINNDDTAAVTIADASGNEDEGAVIFTATLDNAVEGGFEVDVSTADGTATVAGSDYIALNSQTLLFSGAEGEIQNFSVIPTADAILEEDETVNISMSNLSATALGVQITDNAILTINNDDGSAKVTISDAQATEGDVLSFDVTLDTDVEGDVVVDVFFTNITTSNNDYVEAGQQVTFVGGSPGTQSITLGTSDDLILEIDETFTASLSLNSGNPEVITSDTGIGTIIDNDDATLTITDSSTSEGDPLSFILDLDKSVQGELVVDLIFSHGTSENGDFNQTSQRFTFSGGLLGSKTVIVPTTEDLVLEEDETFTVSLSLFSGNSEVVSTDTGIGTINDDDSAQVTIDDITSEEGDTLIFNLILNNDVEGDVVIDVSFTNVSTEANDFTGSLQTFTFTNGDSGIQTVIVPTTEDDQLETDETFTANLSLGAGNVNSEVITSDTGTGTITNDDVAAVTIADASGNEDEGAVVFTATLDFAVEGGFELDVNTADGTATLANGDYTAVTSQTLVFLGNAGETQNFNVTPTADDVLEVDEIVNISMDNLSVTTLDVDITDLASLTILNDDGAANVTISDALATEGGTLSFDVTLDKDVEGDVAINISFVNISTSNNDYEEQVQQVVFTGGAAGTETITLGTTEDLILETDETFTASLSLFSGNLSIITTDTGVGTIIDNDDAAISISDATIVEGGTLSFDLTLDNSVQGDVVIDISFTNISTSDNDYNGLPQQVTFSGGAAGIETITIETTGDLTLETDETFTASLFLSSGNPEVVTSDTGLGTITDDDTAEVTIDDITSEEGELIAFTLSLNNDVEGDVVVDVNFLHVNTEVDDFTNSVQSFTFTNGNSGIKTVTVLTTEDTQVEPNETFTAILLMGSGNVNSEVIISDTGLGTISNDDQAALTISDEFGNEDDGFVTFTATLDFAVEGGFEVDVNTSDGTATLAGNDYTAIIGQTLIFSGAEGETQNFSLIPNPDNVLEEDETVNISMNNLSATVLDVDITDLASLTILNDDGVAKVTINDAQVIEGGVLSFDVSLDNTIQGDVVVDVSFANISTSNNDYDGLTQQVTFIGGVAGTETITLSTTEDFTLEIDETFTASLFLISGNPEVITSDTGLGTIIDDDDASILISDAQVIEGGDLSFDLILDKDVEGDVVIDVSFTNISASNNDYDGLNQQVTFIGGLAGTETITLSTTDDLTLETDETFTASLSLNSGNPEVVTSDTGIGTITNDDSAEITIDDSTSEEGDAIVFNISLNNDVEGDVVVDINFTHISTESNDFTSDVQTITFADGISGTQTVTVATTEDILLESDETFTATLSLGVGNVISEVITNDTGIGTIANDDASEVGIQASIQATEPDTDGLFTLSLTNPVDVDTEVIYTVGGTASPDIDYSGIGSSVTIPANSTEFTIDINVIDDVIVEPGGETVVVSLSSTNNTVTVGLENEATLIIDDDDLSVVTILATDESGQEGTPALDNAEFTVSISKISAVATIISYSVTGTAIEGLDYEALSESISIPAGSLSSTIDVNIIDDILSEKEETVVITLTGIISSDANTNLGTPDVATISIIDNDNDPPVAVADEIDTRDNEETIITILANDSDPDGDVLLVSILTAPEFGEVSVNEDGSLTYIADLGNYCKIDQFTYQICDPKGLCDEATVTIEISVMDSDDDSIPDAVESLIVDTDSDSIPDYLDLDSDNDGISDEYEAQISDSCTDLPVDTDSDGIPDYLDSDSDDDGYSDEEEGIDDCDADGIANYIDSYDDCSEYVSIPEGFSPNGDGVNEFLVFRGVKDFPDSKLIIFNRWGSIIYEIKGYQNNWDARANSSMAVGTDIVPEGTYYYILDLGNGTKPVKGFVYINY